VRSLQGIGDVGLADSGNHSTNCHQRVASRVIINVGGRSELTTHFYSHEMARWVETFYKGPTLHSQWLNPLISICLSRSSDWVRLRCPWPSTKVTLIESNSCNSSAQLYRTTNYWLPLIPFYTARTFHSWRLHSLRTWQSTSTTR